MVHHTQLALGLKFSIEIDEFIDAHPDEYALPPAAADKLTEVMYNFMAVVTALRSFYGDRKLFPITYKYNAVIVCERTVRGWGVGRRVQGWLYRMRGVWSSAINAMFRI